MNNDFPITFTNGTAEYFSLAGRLSDEETMKIMAKTKICRRIKACLIKAATERNLIVGVSRNYFQYLENYFLDAHGNPLLVTIDEDFVTTPINMYYKKVGHGS